ncbi:MAG: hypothetical protein HQK75_10360 [Candidatus Magnetomorum sp.]|nr:hypothetical protein [Candidatus Magnetomorum sp.]
MKKFFLAVVFTAWMGFIPYAFAMDPICDDEMSGIYAATGVDIFIAGTLEIRTSFNDFKYQDDDGVSTTSGGYLWLDGNSESHFNISITNSKLTLDVGTAGAGGLTVNGVANAVEANRSFIKLGLPTLNITTSMADINLKFENAAGTENGSLGKISTSLMSFSIPQTPDALYISAH